jgi:hypothetical protein
LFYSNGPALGLGTLQLVERSTSAAKVISDTDGVFQVLLSDLESCGALSLVFFVMAIPPFRYGDARFDTEVDKESWKLLCHYVITPIEREPFLVGSKKLRPRTATGDTLKNIVEESLLSSSLDRSTDNDVTNALKRLYRSAVLAAGSRKASRSK